MPRQIFKNRVIATAGPLPGQFTADNMKQWTKLRRGHFQETFDDQVTHLLCTQEQFDKRVPIIKNALKNRKDVHILHYDWFEFSTVENKRLPEKDYSMRTILAQKNAERREKARIERGKKEGERGVNSNLFHVYHDEEYFPYQVDIRRDDAEAGDFGQRHTLTLWESNARPHLYWFTAKFLRKKGDSQPKFYRPSPCSGVMNTEMGHFKHFFRVKTGLEWQDRVLKQGTQPATCFQYSPPTGGKPVGGDLRFSYDYCVKINEELQENMQIDTPVSLDPDAGGNALYDRAELNETPDEAESACSTSNDNSDNVQLFPSDGTFIHVACCNDAQC